MDSKTLEIQNPWWADRAAMDRDPHLLKVRGRPYYFKRADLLDVSLERGVFHVLRGPRQVGKTTFLKERIAALLAPPEADASSILFLSCEGLGNFRELQSILVEWLGKMPARREVHVFLDEVSFVDEWQRAILFCSNAGLLANASLIVTGSNARDLKKSSERFPGRRGKGLDLSMHPLAFDEFATLACFREKSPPQLVEAYLQVGGFPHAIRDFVEYGQVTEETYATYRNWIIGDALRYGLSEEFLRQILFRVAETLASRVTWPGLIETTTVKSHETALEYVEHLQDAFLGITHYCYDPAKQGPAYAKSRKLYFVDPLLIYLGLGWKKGLPDIFAAARDWLADSVFKGKVLESVVIARARRACPRSYFWYSTREKKEVDLVIDDPNGALKLFDVKLSSREPGLVALGQRARILTVEDLQVLPGAFGRS